MPSKNGQPRVSLARNIHAANPNARHTIDELARQVRTQFVSINKQFLWHPLFAVAEEDLRQYLQDPIESLPPVATALLPKVGVVLAPYLEKGAGRIATAVVETKPPEAKLALSAHVESPDFVTLFFTVKGEQVADYHYFFYDEISALLSHRWPKKTADAWHSLLREELSSEMHGEVDERSWRLKQALLRRPMNARRDGKPFREYARQSFEDTMTLYLHGICCDIDVDTGPRQLPSRCLRKRLELLKTLFPPPAGRGVFPEDLKEKK
jgi:hypothetical protein